MEMGGKEGKEGKGGKSERGEGGRCNMRAKKKGTVGRRWKDRRGKRKPRKGGGGWRVREREGGRGLGFEVIRGLGEGRECC